jgi:hypothetical protein
MWWIPRLWFRKAGLHHYADGLRCGREHGAKIFLDIEMASLRHFIEEHCFPKWWVEQPAEGFAPETALADKLFTLSVTRYDSQPIGLIPQL